MPKSSTQTLWNYQNSFGRFSKAVRGDKELPIFGLPDLVTAMRGNPYKKGQIKIEHGESYIAN